MCPSFSKATVQVQEREPNHLGVLERGSKTLRTANLRGHNGTAKVDHPSRQSIRWIYGGRQGCASSTWGAHTSHMVVHAYILFTVHHRPGDRPAAQGQLNLDQLKYLRIDWDGNLNLRWNARSVLPFLKSASSSLLICAHLHYAFAPLHRANLNHRNRELSAEEGKAEGHREGHASGGGLVRNRE